MTAAELMSIAVGVANLAMVLVLAVHLRRLGLRPPLPLSLLVAVFAIRAVARLVPPQGTEPETLVVVLDTVLLVVLVLLVMTARRLVTSFAAERDAALRARVDYDEALVHHESIVAGQLGSELERIEHELEAAGAVGTAGDEGARREALARGLELVRELQRGANRYDRP